MRAFWGVGLVCAFLGGCTGGPSLGPALPPSDGFFGGIHLRNYRDLVIGGIYVTPPNTPLAAGADIFQICDIDRALISIDVAKEALGDTDGSWSDTFGGSLTALKIGSVNFGVSADSISNVTYDFKGVEQRSIIASRTRSKTGSIKELIARKCRGFIEQYRDQEKRDVFVVVGAVFASNAAFTYKRKVSASGEATLGSGTGLPGAKAKGESTNDGKRTGTNKYVEIFVDKF